MPISPEQASIRARLGAHALHAQGKTNTEPAREAFRKRFIDEVDPHRVLPEAERTRRAEHARKAYMLRLSLKAAAARRKATS